MRYMILEGEPDEPVGPEPTDRVDSNPDAVVKNVAGCCPYCHVRKGWKIKVERSYLWPHYVTCSQCHKTWATIEEFNADAKRVVLAVLDQNPDKIEAMNRDPEDVEWQTMHNDGIGMRMERQDWDHRRKYGRPWEPYWNDECKPSYIRHPGLPDFRRNADVQEPAAPDGNSVASTKAADSHSREVGAGAKEQDHQIVRRRRKPGTRANARSKGR